MTIRYYYTPTGGSRTNIASAALYYTLDLDMSLRTSRGSFTCQKSVMKGLVNTPQNGDIIEIYSDCAAGLPWNGILAIVQSYKENIQGIWEITFEGYDTYASRKFCTFNLSSTDDDHIISAIASDLGILGWRNFVDGAGEGLAASTWNGYDGRGRKIGDVMPDIDGDLYGGTVSSVFQYPEWNLLRLNFIYVPQGSPFYYRSAGTQTLYSTSPASKVHGYLVKFGGLNRQTLYRKFYTQNMPSRQNYMDYAYGNVAYNDNLDSVINDIQVSGSFSYSGTSSSDSVAKYGTRSVSLSFPSTTTTHDAQIIAGRLIQRSDMPAYDATFYMPNIPYGGGSTYADNWPYGYMQMAYLYDPGKDQGRYSSDPYYTYGYIKKVRFDSRQGTSKITVGLPTNSFAGVINAVTRDIYRLKTGLNQSVKTTSGVKFDSLELSNYSKLPAHLMFRAFRSGTQSVAYGTATRVEYNYPILNNHGSFSGGLFIAPVAGTYLIIAQVSCSMNAGYEFQIYANSLTNGVFSRNKIYSGQNNISRLVDIATFTAGEKVEIGVYTTSGSTVIGDGGDNTYFSAYLLTA